MVNNNKIIFYFKLSNWIFLLFFISFASLFVILINLSHAFPNVKFFYTIKHNPWHQMVENKRIVWFWIMHTKYNANRTIFQGVTSIADENFIIHIVAQVRVKKILFSDFDYKLFCSLCGSAEE